MKTHRITAGLTIGGLLGCYQLACAVSNEDESVGRTETALTVGEYLFTCGGYDAYRGSTGVGFVVTVAGELWTGFTVPLAVRYLPDRTSSLIPVL